MNFILNKYRAVLIFVILTLTISTAKQINAQSKLWIGASAGIQNTYLSSILRSEIDAKSAFRPAIMLNTEYRPIQYLGIQTGLGYSLYTQNTSKFKNNFNYLTIPIYLKMGKFRKERKYALSYFYGMHLNYLLSAKNIYQDEKNDISDFTNNKNTDSILGVGVKYKIQNNLVLETHVIGAMGGLINTNAFDGFMMINLNYGLMFNLKYSFSKE